METPMNAFKTALLALALTASVAAAADPGIDVHYAGGILRVSLAGSFAGAQYRVFRSDGESAVFTPLGAEETLCLGECYAVDLRADPGKTYEYRFDLYWSDGATVSYGPYTVTVPDPPLGVRLWPNPQRGAAMVELTLPGSRAADPVFAEACVLDARGRTVRVLQNGELYRGTTRLAWDGKDAAGRRLVPGAYFVRVSGALGTAVTRFVSL
jgi:hypothetical protein